MKSDYFIFLDVAFSNIVYGTIALLVLLEVLFPRRVSDHSIIVRWSSNIAIGVINALLDKGFLALIGIGVAVTVGQNEWGLLNQVRWPPAIEILITVFALDCLFYWIHRLYHAVPVLWRVHLVHHSDLDFDFSIAFRRHPIEALISVNLVIPLVALLGLPPFGVLLFLLLRSVILYFEHANLQLPDALDRTLRLFIITPDMHRVHHSATRTETDSNFGDLFSFWDRLFGTYHEQPAGGHEAMRIGLDYLRNPRELYLHRLLMQPFMDLGDVSRSPGAVNQTAPADSIETTDATES